MSKAFTFVFYLFILFVQPQPKQPSKKPVPAPTNSTNGPNQPTCNGMNTGLANGSQMGQHGHISYTRGNGSSYVGVRGLGAAVNGRGGFGSSSRIGNGGIRRSQTGSNGSLGNGSSSGASSESHRVSQHQGPRPSINNGSQAHGSSGHNGSLGQSVNGGGQGQQGSHSSSASKGLRGPGTGVRDNPQGLSRSFNGSPAAPRGRGSHGPSSHHGTTSPAPAPASSPQTSAAPSKAERNPGHTGARIPSGSLSTRHRGGPGHGLPDNLRGRCGGAVPTSSFGIHRHHGSQGGGMSGSQGNTIGNTRPRLSKMGYYLKYIKTVGPLNQHAFQYIFSDFMQIYGNTRHVWNDFTSFATNWLRLQNVVGPSMRPNNNQDVHGRASLSNGQRGHGTPPNPPPAIVSPLPPNGPPTVSTPIAPAPPVPSRSTPTVTLPTTITFRAPVPTNETQPVHIPNSTPTAQLPGLAPIAPTFHASTTASGLGSHAPTPTIPTNPRHPFHAPSSNPGRIYHGLSGGDTRTPAHHSPQHFHGSGGGHYQAHPNQSPQHPHGSSRGRYQAHPHRSPQHARGSSRGHPPSHPNHSPQYQYGSLQGRPPAPNHSPHYQHGASTGIHPHPIGTTSPSPHATPPPAPSSHATSPHATSPHPNPNGGRNPSPKRIRLANKQFINIDNVCLPSSWASPKAIYFLTRALN